MPRIKPTVEKTVTKSYTAKLTASEIKSRFRLPVNAKIEFTVPGGGDWSGEHIELDDQNHGLTASWETTK